MKPQVSTVPRPEEVHRAFNDMGDIVMGRFLRGLSVATTAKPFAHGLRRVPIAWWPVNRGSTVVPVESQDPDENNIYLSAASAITVDLVVF